MNQEMAVSAQDVKAIPYATPDPRRQRMGAVVVPIATLFAGLGLILLAGCFLIGVLIVLSDPSLRVSDSGTLLLVVLYLFAFLSFGGGIAVGYLGIRWLYQYNTHHGD